MAVKNVSTPKIFIIRRFPRRSRAALLFDLTASGSAYKKG